MRMRRSVRQDEAPWKLTAQSAEAAAPPATSTSLLLHHIKYIFCLITTAAAWSGGGAGGRGCPRTSRTPKKMYYVYVYTKYICIHMRSRNRARAEQHEAIRKDTKGAKKSTRTPTSLRAHTDTPPHTGRAGGEDHFVGPDRGLRADKSHVHQRFGLQQCVEGSQDVVLVIVPAQAVVILWGRARTWCPS